MIKRVQLLKNLPLTAFIMSFKHKIAQRVLGWFARKIIHKYQPRVIGITGSLGKTSTKEAIAKVLGGSFTVRKNERNFNTEIGIPLTIIGCLGQPRNLLDWWEALLNAIELLLFRDRSYPAIVVLEMGADHPGDIRTITEIAPCDIGVVTAVGPTHLEYFNTVEEVLKEKSILVSHLRKGGTAILNHDDALVYPLRHKTQAHVLTYGFSTAASVRALEMNTTIDPWLHHEKSGALGSLAFKVRFQGAMVPVRMQQHIGNPSVYAALAAIAVGVSFGINLHTIVERLGSWKGLPGRLSLIRGVRDTLIIDDTYNSSPVAAVEALSLLKGLAPIGHRRWAVVGDMLELGAFTKEAHEEVGAAVVAKANADLLVTVGERARDIARSAEMGGLSKDVIFSFATPEEAGRFIQNRLQEGDVLLVKGSRGMHMEKIVKELMAEPLRAEELLVHA
ncbi:MAG: UDP-N-acetylmuramoyl-tripeptide--D-alanyl-D-alanine ligase [Patescibacteria group bacterium]